MKVFIIVLLVLVGSVAFVSCSSDDKQTTTQTEQKQLYTCGMHPEIIRDESGDCPICGMKLMPVKQSTMGGTDADAGGEKKILYYKDPMHPWYTSEHPGKAPDCGMDLVPVYEGQEGSAGVIRIDPAVEQNINVKIGEAEKRSLSTTIRTNGHIAIAEPRQAILNTKISGWVEKLYVDYVGQSVRRGQKLMEIYSPEFVAAEQELITALDYQKGVSSSSFNDVAKSGDALLETAKRKLQLWDITDEQIQQIVTSRKIQRTITLHAPARGVVLEKNVIQGQRVQTGEQLLKIADLSIVWLHADLYEYELGNAKVGQKAVMTLPFAPGRTFTGRVAFFYPTLVAKSRTGRVRIDFPNPKMELKPEMFADVEIFGDPIHDAVVVPEQAVIRGGTRDMIVVSLGGGRFEPREVTLGILSQGFYQILKGVQPGERIVLSAQFLIDSESNLRAALNAMTGEKADTPRSTDSKTAVPTQGHNH